MKRKCPICHKILSAEQQKTAKQAGFFPFCSRRCRLIDLGAWLDAEYRVISEPQPEEPLNSANDLPDAEEQNY